ncbi:sodium:calcium symporter [Fervidicella metallireducens AeB]|uniref:Sodium:calcium symporter n=1 Tax=Fervidicella metallireducens AeB TaxID=1403537 RepID=A0A017RTR9_9CLOT|nr:sodium-dependent transporter [Fervidicella metallireducens]EYE88148.1 sodium:calcium symporter [Fervidicella metallireducens AeB]
MSAQREQWGSRLGFILAAIGMAVGTGNIWRFPRVAGTNGGGTFLVAYLIANLVWAVPIIMTEIAIGKQTHLGTIGSFRDFAGKKKAWQGGWIGWVCAAITFYYVVVFAWAIRYFVFAVDGSIRADADTQVLWDRFIGSPSQTILFQIIALIIAGFIIYKGVKGGLEVAGKIMIPVLFICLIIAAVWSCTKPGASVGLEFLFVPKWSELFNSKLWLNAFTQAAWSTGAGWGMMVTYANYMKKNEDIATNSFMIVFGDMLGAIAGGLAVLPTVFALSASQEAAVGALKAGNTGLTFIYLTKLFTTIPAGRIIAMLFFLALALAALTSLLPMMEVIVKNFIDAGYNRKRATITVLIITFIFGLPSAYSINFLNNQDWVWGIGLLFCGLFFAFTVYKFGTNKFLAELINKTSDIKAPAWYYNTCIRIYPIILVVLVGWWIAQAIGWSGENWWNPIAVDNVGTLAVQIVVSIIVFYLANNWLSKWIKEKSEWV